MKISEFYNFLNNKEKNLLKLIFLILIVEIFLLVGLSYTVSNLVGSISLYNQFLVWIVVFLVLSIFIELLVNYKEFKFINILSKITYGLQLRIIQAYISSESNETSFYFLEQKISKVIRNIGEIIVKSLTIFKILIFGVLIIIELKLFSFILPIFILFAVLSSKKSNQIMNFWETRYRETQGKFIHKQRQIISGRLDIKQFKYYSAIDSDYSDVLNQSLIIEMSYQKKIRGQLFGINLLNIFLFVVLLLIGVYMHHSFNYSLENLMFLIFLFYQIQTNYSNGYNLMLAIYEIIIFGSEIKDILKNDTTNNSQESNINISSLELEDIIVRFNQSKLCIESKLKIQKGTPLLLKGKNGSGKTTILKILNSLVKDFEAKILIDNSVASIEKLSSISDLCQLTSNESIVFDNSILSNIVLDKEVDFSQIIKIGKKVYLDDVFNLNCEENWNSNALKYSLGIQQRILIARALYQEKFINLFDEALDNIDKQNRKKILINIIRHFKDKILVFSSHDLVTFSKVQSIEIKSKIISL